MTTVHRLFFMPAHLFVALHSGSGLLEIHALDDGIFSVFPFDADDRPLPAALPFQGGILFLPLLSDGISKCKFCPPVYTPMHTSVCIWFQTMGVPETDAQM